MYWIVLGSGCDEICCNRPGVVVGMRDLQRARENNGQLSQTAY